MRVAAFSTKSYDRQFLSAANASHGHELDFFEPRLAIETAPLAADRPCVCAFVNDCLDEHVLDVLARQGTRLIALRSAGFNHVDLAAAARHGLKVVRVPAYSPHAVAEHTIGMILSLNRKLHKAYARVREGNFALDGLLGFDLCGRTAGIVGTGKIGEVVVRILRGFGCHALAYDVRPSPEVVALGGRYVPLGELLAASDVISLHCPLMPATYHMIDEAALARMKPDAMLINTSRGGLVDTPAVIRALKEGRIGYFGIDVYEEEAELFFEDRSAGIISDDVFTRLLTFPNVLITGHQAFFTREALHTIGAETLASITAFERGERLVNEVAARG